MNGIHLITYIQLYDLSNTFFVRRNPCFFFFRDSSKIRDPQFENPCYNKWADEIENRVPFVY